MRLRTLYIDQLYRLKHVLREKRRNYIHSLRTERETLCECNFVCMNHSKQRQQYKTYLSSTCLCPIAGNIHSQPKETIVERKLYEKLKALNKYQKRHGVEAIMYKKYLEKRQKVGIIPHIIS